MPQIITNDNLQWFFDNLFIPLLAFFAFPAMQYAYLKVAIGREGMPKLWYLPKYGFRLVIRNIPGKKILTDIRYRTIVRTIHPSGLGSSVSTSSDNILNEKEEFFLFPDYDHVIISFKLDDNQSKDIDFVFTDKLGQEIQRIPISTFDILVCDYIATVENRLNFNIRIARRVEVKTTLLRSIWEEIQDEKTERSFPLDKVFSVG